jgi:TPR repeat protein
MYALTTAVLTFAGPGAAAHPASEAAVIAALRAGHAQDALDLALQETARGNAWAMDTAAQLYLAAPAPVPHDPARALALLGKAADLGYGESMNRLGEMYFNGTVGTRDVARAIAWYRRGVDAGSRAAMNNLASCLLEGTGVAQDIAAGMTMLRSAAETDPVAQENLATLYRSGRYGPRQLPEALALYERSAASGSSTAMVALAQMYYNGEGTAADLALSCRWAALASTKGRKEAAAHVANVCRPKLSRDAFAHEREQAKLWVDAHPDAFGLLARP